MRYSWDSSENKYGLFMASAQRGAEQGSAAPLTATAGGASKFETLWASAQEQKNTRIIQELSTRR